MSTPCVYQTIVTHGGRFIDFLVPAGGDQCGLAPYMSLVMVAYRQRDGSYDLHDIRAGGPPVTGIDERLARFIAMQRYAPALLPGEYCGHAQR